MKLNKKILVAILFLAFSLNACNSTVDVVSNISKISNTKSIIYGADEYGGICCLDNGLIYIQDKIINFYDIENDKIHPLCSRVNCTHAGIDCPAFIDDDTTVNGLAYYNDKVYAFYDSFEKNSVEFIQMNLDGTNKKNIYHMDKGDFKPDTWQINCIEDQVYYSNGVVWFSINWDYIIDRNETKNGYSQLCCIKLDNGKLLSISDRSDDKTNYVYSYFINDFAIFCKKQVDKARLSESSFYKQYNDGAYKDLVGDESLDLYYRYLLSFNSQYPERYEYLCYDINNQKITSLESGDSIPIYDDSNDKNSMIFGYADPYLFCGEYDKKLLVSNYIENINENNESEFYLWNFENNTKTKLSKINMHGVYSVSNFGNLFDNIFDNSKMFYSVYKENDMMDFYCYDFNTSESTFLFEDKQYLSWRPQYETDEFFLCQKGDPNIFGEEVEDLYKISKDDYLNGNFKNAKKIKL